MSLAADLLARARAASVRIATAESCTGGLVAGAITDVPGSSDIFDHGVVTYSNAAKMRLLDVRKATLDSHGAVSEEVAREMAEGALAGTEATLSVAVTGIAGPGGSEHKPEGRVCFATCRDGRCRTETVEFGPLGRDRVRGAAVDHALGMLLDALAD